FFRRAAPLTESAVSSSGRTLRIFPASSSARSASPAAMWSCARLACGGSQLGASSAAFVKLALASAALLRYSAATPIKYCPGAKRGAHSRREIVIGFLRIALDEKDPPAKVASVHVLRSIFQHLIDVIFCAVVVLLDEIKLDQPLFCDRRVRFALQQIEIKGFELIDLPGARIEAAEHVQQIFIFGIGAGCRQKLLLGFVLGAGKQIELRQRDARAVELGIGLERAAKRFLRCFEVALGNVDLADVDQDLSVGRLFFERLLELGDRLI